MIESANEIPVCWPVTTHWEVPYMALVSVLHLLSWRRSPAASGALCVIDGALLLCRALNEADKSLIGTGREGLWKRSVSFSVRLSAWVEMRAGNKKSDAGWARTT